MKKRENSIKIISTINENSLNFELAKIKHKIRANYSLVSQTNLYIFTKECAVSAYLNKTT